MFAPDATPVPQSVSSAQERLSRAEVRCEHLQQERTLLRESEARLLAEREAAQRERTQTSLLLSNMEAIKNNLERAQSSAAAQLENQVWCWAGALCAGWGTGEVRMRWAGVYRV